MPKDTFLKVRLDPADMLQIERQAKVLNMPKSRLARLLLTGGSIAKPQEVDRPTTGRQIDDSRLVALEAGIEEIRSALSLSAASFDALLGQLNQILRTPTFTEYRARLHAEGVEKRQTETDEQFLLRAAQRYFIAHGIWPDPADSRRFGRLPAGYDPAKFPKSPPV